MIDSGKLSKRIIIQQLEAGSPTRDDYGQPNETWGTLAEVWAKIKPLRGRELWAQQQVQSEITQRVVIRYRNDVTSKMRIKVKGTSRFLVIKSVIDTDEKHEELQLMCAEGLSDA